MKESIVVLPTGVLRWNGKEYRCALGVGGVKAQKREGDGATPAGSFALRKVLYRADRIAKPETQLPIIPLEPNDGWCDDSADAAYNTQVKIPHLDSHEKLWREDAIYDIIVPLGYNDNPPVSGRGSAIFLHVARPEYTPTAGCVALAVTDLLEVLKSIDTDTEIRIDA